MASNNKLTDLKNIGTKIASRLNEAGIFSEQELRFYGAVSAHKRIKHIYPNETLSVCYYLYSFEGALTNKHWNDLSNNKKRQLKNAINE